MNAKKTSSCDEVAGFVFPLACGKDQQKNPRLATRVFEAGWTRLELATSDVTGRRSNQLSYHP